MWISHDRRGRSIRSSARRLLFHKNRIRPDLPLIAAFLFGGAAIWMLDPSLAFSAPPAWAMPARFMSTELALPNFLKATGDEANAGSLLELAELDASGIQPWGGPIADRDFEQSAAVSSPHVLARAGASAATLAGSIASGSGSEPSTPIITSGFGFRNLDGVTRHHDGIDIAMPYGTPIRALWDGQVSYAGWRSGYGLVVVVDHGQGKQSLYAHASSLCVLPGDAIHAGDVVGNVGATGHAFGPHLHFEIRYDNVPVDPEEEYIHSAL